MARATKPKREFGNKLISNIFLESFSDKFDSLRSKDQLDQEVTRSGALPTGMPRMDLESMLFELFKENLERERSEFFQRYESERINRDGTPKRGRPKTSPNLYYQRAIRITMAFADMAEYLLDYDETKPYVQEKGINGILCELGLPLPSLDKLRETMNGLADEVDREVRAQALYLDLLINAIREIIDQLDLPIKKIKNHLDTAKASVQSALKEFRALAKNLSPEGQIKVTKVLEPIERNSATRLRTRAEEAYVTLMTDPLIKDEKELRKTGRKMLKRLRNFEKDLLQAGFTFASYNYKMGQRDTPKSKIERLMERARKKPIYALAERTIKGKKNRGSKKRHSE